MELTDLTRQLVAELSNLQILIESGQISPAEIAESSCYLKITKLTSQIKPLL